VTILQVIFREVFLNITVSAETVRYTGALWYESNEKKKKSCTSLVGDFLLQYMTKWHEK
jgi:hypothetical protein